MCRQLLAISLGASLGAILRWLAGLALNPLCQALPLGTLAANWLGGYLVGLATALFALHPAVAPEWRLFVITGFLGGLTTFSTFSVEITTLLHSGRFGLAAAAILLHVGGAVGMTILGLFTVSAFR